MQPLITPADVKLQLRSSLSWVYKAAKLGILPSIPIEPLESDGKEKVKGLLRFRQEDIDAFIEARYRPGRQALCQK